MGRTPNILIAAYGEIFTISEKNFKQYLLDFVEAERNKTPHPIIEDYGARSLGILRENISDFDERSAGVILEFTYGEKVFK